MAGRKLDSSETSLLPIRKGIGQLTSPSDGVVAIGEITILVAHWRTLQNIGQNLVKIKQTNEAFQEPKEEGEKSIANALDGQKEEKRTTEIDRKEKLFRLFLSLPSGLLLLLLWPT